MRVAAITPMFSAYVVTPVPPTAPLTIVATPSPMKARPMYWSRFLPVMAVTALMWPRFSATRMMTTGTISSMAGALNTGAWNCGRPNQAALAMPDTSIGLPRPMPLVSSAYSRLAMISPTRISRRCSMPLVNTATSATHTKVRACIQASKLLAAMFLMGMPARFSPITATTAPVTTGGMKRSIQPVPTRCTTTPTSVYTRPQAMMPPSATPMLALGPLPA